uniref:ZP domain-containing protein n=1 Tax=Acrobeloides nanus TaxID=290746 RepID=A0A914E5L8_9BILA
MLWCYGVLLLLFLEPLVGGQLVFDNQIEGSPEISCGHGQINFKVKTTKGTPSSIYVKGNSDNKDCVIRDSENASIPLNTCNMRRKREVNPAGIGYAMTIIVQLHPLFVTKVDRAYNVHCFYMEAHKNIDTELFVR